MGAAGDKDKKLVRERIHVRRFVRPGVVWWAFDWKSAETQAKLAASDAESAESQAPAGESPAPAAEMESALIPESPKGWQAEHGVVVLIDEIDKADPSVPNGLLDAFGHGRFEVPGVGAVAMVEKNRPPLVVITTNEERSLPDAFLRRCLVLHLRMPEDEAGLVNRGEAHFPECDKSVLKRAARMLLEDREICKNHDLPAPGLAEYVDLIRAVTEQADKTDEQLRLLTRIEKFTFEKHHEVTYNRHVDGAENQPAKGSRA